MMEVALQVAAVVVEFAAVGVELTLGGAQFAGFALLLLIGTGDTGGIATAESVAFLGAGGVEFGAFAGDAGFILAHGRPILADFADVSADIAAIAIVGFGEGGLQ